MKLFIDKIMLIVFLMIQTCAISSAGKDYCSLEKRQIENSQINQMFRYGTDESAARDFSRTTKKTKISRLPLWMGNLLTQEQIISNKPNVIVVDKESEKTAITVRFDVSPQSVVQGSKSPEEKKKIFQQVGVQSTSKKIKKKLSVQEQAAADDVWLDAGVKLARLEQKTADLDFANAFSASSAAPAKAFSNVTRLTERIKNISAMDNPKQEVLYLKRDLEEHIREYGIISAAMKTALFDLKKGAASVVLSLQNDKKSEKYEHAKWLHKNLIDLDVIIKQGFQIVYKGDHTKFCNHVAKKK